LLTIFYLYKVLCSLKAMAWLMRMLWIAYNFLSLQGSLQFRKRLTIIRLRCELLTIFYLYKVLCSLKIFYDCAILLWIAYNFLSLQGSLQYTWTNICCCWRCELLTIFYLYKVLCSPLPYSFNLSQVVNCLQFFIFTRFFAVQKGKNREEFLLWIAYNFLSLQGSLQSSSEKLNEKFCCELLTIFYLYKVLCSKHPQAPF